MLLPVALMMIFLCCTVAERLRRQSSIESGVVLHVFFSAIGLLPVLIAYVWCCRGLEWLEGAWGAWAYAVPGFLLGIYVSLAVVANRSR
jgi:hypothetical protein